MRSRRLKTTIRLLDIKTLCEYFANTCTYVGGLEKSAHNGFHVVETYEQFSDIGKPFFDLLTRLSLTDMIAYFKHSTLESVDEFFIGISSSSFLQFVKDNSKDICNNKYADEKWSDEAFSSMLSCIWDDADHFHAFVNYLNSEVLDTYLTVASGNATVLGIYSNLPTLQEGLLRRCHSNDKFKLFNKQPSLMQDALIEFTKYCDSLHFDEDSNMETIVEKYLGSVMQFFISKWFKVLQNEHLVGSVGNIDSSGRLRYYVDSVQLHEEATKVDIDLLETFSSIEDVDVDLFQRVKGKGYARPYRSIVDILLPYIEPRITAGIQKLYDVRRTSDIAKMYTFEVQPALGNSALCIGSPVRYTVPCFDRSRRESMLFDREALLLGKGIIDSTDASFKAKIQANKELVLDIYNKCQNMTATNYHEVVFDIVTNHCAGRVRDNSNTYYVDRNLPNNFIEPDNKYYELYDDLTYQRISKIIKCISRVVKLNGALHAYGTSLAVVWSQYLMHFPDRQLNIFNSCSTIPSFMSCIGLGHENTDSDSFSDGLDATPVTFIATAEIKSEVYKLLKMSAKSLVTEIPKDLKLGNAHIPSKTVFDSRTEISTAYTQFTHFQFELPQVGELYRIFINEVLNESRLQSFASSFIFSKNTKYKQAEAPISLIDFVKVKVSECVQRMTQDSLNIVVGALQDGTCELLMRGLLVWLPEQSRLCDNIRNEFVQVSLEDLQSFTKMMLEVDKFCEGSYYGYNADFTDELAELTPLKNIFNALFSLYSTIYILVMTCTAEIDGSRQSLADPDYIMDISFSIISLLDGIAVQSNTATKTNRNYMSCLRDVKKTDLFMLKKDKKERTYFIDIAHLLLVASSTFSIINTELAIPLNQASDIAFGLNDPYKMLIDSLRKSLHIQVAPGCNQNVKRDQVLSRQYCSCLCGAIRIALKAIDTSYLAGLKQLNKDSALFRNYISDSLSLRDLVQPLNNKNSRNFEFTLNSDLYIKALSTEEYYLAKMRSQWTAATALQELRVEVQNYAIDNHYYRKQDGTYVSFYNPETGTDYYLTEDLVYVGRCEDSIDCKSASEISLR